MVGITAFAGEDTKRRSVLKGPLHESVSRLFNGLEQDPYGGLLRSTL